MLWKQWRNQSTILGGTLKMFETDEFLSFSLVIHQEIFQDFPLEESPKICKIGWKMQFSNFFCWGGGVAPSPWISRCILVTLWNQCNSKLWYMYIDYYNWIYIVVTINKIWPVFLKCRKRQSWFNYIVICSKTSLYRTRF